MQQFHHPSCNDELRGSPIMRCVRGITSFWLPSEAELAALNSGSAVMLTFPNQAHPPVLVRVTKQQDPTGPSESPPDDLLQLAKDLVSHANKTAKDHPETGRLTDRLLDLIPAMQPESITFPVEELRRLRQIIELLLQQGHN